MFLFSGWVGEERGKRGERNVHACCCLSVCQCVRTCQFAPRICCTQAHMKQTQARTNTHRDTHDTRTHAHTHTVTQAHSAHLSRSLSPTVFGLTHTQAHRQTHINTHTHTHPISLTPSQQQQEILTSFGQWEPSKKEAVPPYEPKYKRTDRVLTSIRRLTAAGDSLGAAVSPRLGATGASRGRSPSSPGTSFKNLLG